MVHINYVAVLVAVIANFFFGFLWYTPLFGKAWAKEKGFVIDRKPTAGELGKGLVINLIGNILLAYVFAHNMAAWSFVPGMSEAPAMTTILQSAIFTWLGFFVPIDLNGIAWEKHSWKLFFINTGYHLGMLIIAATILTVM